MTGWILDHHCYVWSSDGSVRRYRASWETWPWPGYATRQEGYGPL